MMTLRNRYRPERRSGASTRFAREDLSACESGGYEASIFKPPPNGWTLWYAPGHRLGNGPPYYDCGGLKGIHPPAIVGRIGNPTTEPTGSNPPSWFSRPRESIACRKVTFRKDDAEKKVTFISGIEPARRRPRESIQNRSGPVGSSPPTRVGRIVNPTPEPDAGRKVTFSRDDAERKMTFISGIEPARRRPRESIRNRSGPVGSSPPTRVGRIVNPTPEPDAGRKVTFGRNDAEKKVTFISGVHDVDIGCKGRRRTPWGLAQASDGSSPSDRDVGQFGESGCALNFRADGGHPGRRRRPREPVRENDRLQRPPGVGRSVELDPVRRVWARCAVDAEPRCRGVSRRERLLKIRRTGVLYPC